MSFRWFGSKKSRHSEPAGQLIKEMEARYRELDERFRKIEQSLDRLAAKSPQITIEHVHIYQPVLEKMEYRLDSLDIEHLSGSLNLGNNFGAKISGDASSAKPPSPQKTKPPMPGGGTPPTNPGHAPQQPDGSAAGLHRTPTGFRIKKG